MTLGRIADAATDLTRDWVKEETKRGREIIREVAGQGRKSDRRKQPWIELRARGRLCRGGPSR